MTDKEEYPFVVANLWHPEKPLTWQNLCIYTYGRQVQFGNIDEAENFKKYVERMSKNVSADNPHKIYRINFEEVKENQNV
jgi:hypothetical protein